jgi:hypothetical protein
MQSEDSAAPYVEFLFLYAALNNFWCNNNEKYLAFGPRTETKSQISSRYAEMRKPK